MALGKAAAATLVLTTLICLLERANLARAARTSADIGICETIRDGRLEILDCIKGEANFCCLDKLVSNSDGLTKWTKKCCTEGQYVQDNMFLVTTLLVLAMCMFNVALVIILSSFSTIILTEKASLD